MNESERGKQAFAKESPTEQKSLYNTFCEITDYYNRRTIDDVYEIYFFFEKSEIL